MTNQTGFNGYFFLFRKRFGSEELKQQFLVPSISGDYVGALAVSEPGGGSDVAALKVPLYCL